MPDRSLRLLTLPPQSPQGGERGAVLLRERPATPPDASTGRASGDEGSSSKDSPPSDSSPNASPPNASSPSDDNPFAPPPEGTPDRPWQPRRPGGGGQPSGNSPWGSQWSDRQPGRSGGGFGERPGGPPEGGGPNSGPTPSPRWDPTDPSQRRARYALLCGMWAFFFALFGWPYVALLLGALALNWGISALRAKPRTPDPDNPQPPGRPQTTAAVSGIVTASLALALVALTFTAQLVYRDYYTCTNDALTSKSEQACEDLLPEQLRDVLGGNS